MTRYIKFYFVLSQKQKTNPNPSPIGTRVGFVCCGGADSFIDEHSAEGYVSPLNAASISSRGMLSMRSGFLLALIIKVK